MSDYPNGIYEPKFNWQPICAGTDKQGELVWTARPKEPWHQRMFPVRYRGDFTEQWMWLTVMERYGLGWSEKED